ncbi:pantothenate kinase [Tamaricihabitans halophyticus]|uniref:Pantothenate kinase n=1 Tax=Tamaricihabitans halophyticus TaxID=1262583 RepID=A0A4R2R5F4_9PSEU|nr:nucleoside/nucleotide kinase family protein [Tamaricihabitans halophyticus]TCP57214.1 pantothenate kinase [Tamaricihabitans halophyticus]
MNFDELLARAETLAAQGRRRLLGICGAPASGKSTVATRLTEALGDKAICVGMDGFHLAQRELERLGRAARKGAPDTFDAHGYLALLRRLREPIAGETVYAPEFRREIEEPVACAVPVSPEVPLVLTEGNYLLLDDEPWHEVRGLLDETWFLEPDEQTRMDWLIARHERYGRTRAQAEERAYGSDQANAERIAVTARHADLVLRDLAWQPQDP